MLLDASGDCQHVRIEDDVLLGKPDLFCQKPVRPGADLDLAFDRVGLSRLIEGHDHDRCPVAPDQLRTLEERPLAFLQTD